MLLFLLLELLEEAAEVRLGILHEFAGGVVLKHLAVGENQHSVTFDDRVEAMGNRDHC